MIRKTILALLGVAWTLAAFADEPKEEQPTPHPHRAPIEITINPEARVSVALADALPTTIPCGTPELINVLVMNHGFATSSLHASLLEPTPSGVILTMPAVKLTGQREQSFVLALSMTKAGLSDVTISFAMKNEPTDLGGRDRVHFVMRCR